MASTSIPVATRAALGWREASRQTLDIVRSVVDVVEEEVLRLASRGDEATLREAVLRYSRGD